MKRTHIEPLSGNATAVLMFVRRAMALSRVSRIEISARGILVEREMPDAEEPVVPESTTEVDVEYLLETKNLVPLKYQPDQHGMLALYDGVQEITKSRRQVMAIVVPGWRLFSAWLGVEATNEPPPQVFGCRVIYVDGQLTNNRVIVLGAPKDSLFLSDVDFGITIDLGI